MNPYFYYLASSFLITFAILVTLSVHSHFAMRKIVRELASRYVEEKNEA